MSLLGLSLLFFPLNYEARYERNETQAVEAVHPQNFSGGVQYNRWRGLLEYANYNQDSGSGSYQIRRTHRDIFLQGGYDFIQQPLANDFHWKLYAGAALGSYKETVETVLASASSSDSDGERWTMGPLAGVGIHYKFIAAEVEARALFGDNYDPQPQFGYVVRLGVQIPLWKEKKKSNPSPQMVPSKKGTT